MQNPNDIRKYTGGTPIEQEVWTDSEGAGVDNRALEIRIVKLDSKFDNLKDALGKLLPKIETIHTDVATIKADLKHVPSTFKLTVIIITVFLGAFAVVQIPPLFTKGNQIEAPQHEATRYESERSSKE